MPASPSLLNRASIGLIHLDYLHFDYERELESHARFSFFRASIRYLGCTPSCTPFNTPAGALSLLPH